MAGAKVKNPRKEFNWSIQFIDRPINPYLFQKVEVPEKNIEQVKHGDVNRDVKTGGRAEIGNMTAEKLLTTSGSDTWLWDWMAKIADTTLGGGAPPEEYWERVLVSELAEDGVTIINQWICSEVWPCKLNGQGLDRMSSNNSMEKIEFSVGDLDKI